MYGVVHEFVCLVSLRDTCSPVSHINATPGSRARYLTNSVDDTMVMMMMMMMVTMMMMMAMVVVVMISMMTCC